MLQLNPAETYVVNRILKDWADNTTYYVQAKVYDADTRAVLATLNLTDNGSRWYSKSYKVPYDDMRRDGRRLIVITSVFTDSGYTTRSNNHYDEVEEILVQQRFNAATVFGAGGGSDINKDELIKALKEAIAEALVKEDAGEAPEPMDLIVTRCLEAYSQKIIDPIITPIAEVKAQIAGLPKPKDPEKVDFEPLLEAIAAVGKLISSLPKPKDVNFDPHVEAIKKDLKRAEVSILTAMQSQPKRDLVLSLMDGESMANENKSRRLKVIAAKHGIKT